MCSPEAERLRNFFFDKDIRHASFDFHGLCYAAGLTSGDPQLQTKLTDILEELKSQGHIRTYNYVGMIYWIRR